MKNQPAKEFNRRSQDIKIQRKFERMTPIDLSENLRTVYSIWMKHINKLVDEERKDTGE